MMGVDLLLLPEWLFLKENSWSSFFILIYMKKIIEVLHFLIREWRRERYRIYVWKSWRVSSRRLALLHGEAPSMPENETVEIEGDRPVGRLSQANRNIYNPDEIMPFRSMPRSMSNGPILTDGTLSALGLGTRKDSVSYRDAVLKMVRVKSFSSRSQKEQYLVEVKELYNRLNGYGYLQGRLERHLRDLNIHPVISGTYDHSILAGYDTDSRPNEQKMNAKEFQKMSEREFCEWYDKTRSALKMPPMAADWGSIAGLAASAAETLYRASMQKKRKG